MNYKSKFHKAFTLAEVLVTLGIIGVVAALTLPILTNKHQNSVALAGIKVAYAKINDGFLFMRSDENLDDLRSLSVFRNMTPETFQDESVQANLDEQMKKSAAVFAAVLISGTVCAENLIHNGDYYRLAAPEEGSELAAWMFAAADGSEALAAAAALDVHGNAPASLIRLKGLRAESEYRDEEGRIYSGSGLMRAGIPLPRFREPYGSWRLRLWEVNHDESK